MPNGQHLHVMESHDFKVGDLVFANVDKENRNLTRKNHSAAHLLQAALQNVVGSHVHQQGSQVSSTYCRFDFNNYNTLTDEEILKVEDLVNEYIVKAYKVNTHVLAIEEAKKMGAMALFGEKYGAKVRVVDMQISKEFCAGTHVDSTNEVEAFAINSFESIGSGVFRITASTSHNAMSFVKEATANIESSIHAVVNKANEVITEAKSNNIDLVFEYEYKEPTVFGYRYILELRKELALAQTAMKKLEKEYTAKKSQNALSDLNRFDNEIVDGKLFAKVEAIDSNLLKDMAAALRNNKNLSVVFFASVDTNKVTFVCATNGYDASLLVKEAAKITLGGGGGKKDLAQAGGKDVTKVDEAIAKAKELAA